MTGRIIVTTAIIISLATWSAGIADIVYLKDRGKLEGEVIPTRDDPDHLTVKTRFGNIRVARSKIERIESTAAPAESKGKEEKGKDEAPPEFTDTADDQFKFASWLRAHGQSAEATKKLERVIELDPNHAEARKLLGYKLVDGQWMTRDAEMEAQGYVKYRGKYILPQQKEALEQSETQSETRKELFRRVRYAERLLSSPDEKRQQQGFDLLQSITDPLAVEPIVEVLFERPDDAFRGVAIETLGSIEGRESDAALLRATLEDPARSNRTAAVDILVARKTPELIGQAMAYLTNNDNDKVARSAVLLGAFKDPSAIGPLVEALETKHRYVHEPTPQEIADSISNKKYVVNRTEILPDGTMVQRSRPRVTPIRGFAGEAKVIDETKRNPDVLRALIAITGQDFGYDEKAWERWLTEEHQRKAKQP
jgi:hypothetical protein